jgi:hypothetical protein
MNVKLSPSPHKVDTPRTQRLLNIRSALQAYLQQSPPKQQVEKLEHLLHKLVSSDGDDHQDEQSSLAEIRGVIASYLQEETVQIPFRVLLAPQSEDQLSRICSLLGDATPHQGAGGKGITVGEFHTREYADTVCREYRELGYFCVVTDEQLAGA